MRNIIKKKDATAALASSTAKKHKSIMGSLKYAIRLPYPTNAVDLVRKNR